MKKYKRITVWAGAAPTIAEVYREPMYEIGQLLAKKKITIRNVINYCWSYFHHYWRNRYKKFF